MAKTSIVIFLTKKLGGAMPKGYHHLTKEERCQIYALKKRGDSLSTIARELDVNKSTISREIKRNSGQKGYRYRQANEKAIQRRQDSNNAKHKMTPELTYKIEEKINLAWSPVQISGRLKKENAGVSVSHETIYKHIWANKRKGGMLYKKLRHSGKRYNKRGKGKVGRGCIQNRVDIDDRPSIVEKKSRLGDWELDTIIGKEQSGAIVSMVERSTKLTKLVKVNRRTADSIENALNKCLEPIKDFVFTLTADNGKEFANHQEVAKTLEAGFYFAKPYHSWQRGLNEHTNGLVRQYFPKSMSFAEISQDDLIEVEKLLNNRPRKVLEFMTPIEVFDQLSNQSPIVALRT